MRLASSTIALAALAFVACGMPTLPPPALDKPPPQATATEDAFFLVYPEADAESLLGRAVQASGDGGFTIADARAPGCEVTVRREKAAYHRARDIEASSMTTLAAGYSHFVALQAKFGRETKLSIDIDNVEVVRGDLRGACGENVIDTVFVGHGKRALARSAQASGSASVNVGVVSASPNVDTAAKDDAALEWKEDQAYGFRFTKNAKAEPLRVRATLPSIVSEADKIEVKFESDKPAWLVVYYIDSKNHADVLWPSNEEPEPHVEPGKPITLPSPAERAAGIAIKAALYAPGTPSRETLVVYAFADKRDFDAMKPPTGAESKDGAAFAAELTKKLGTIPLSRWSNAVMGYVIEPKEKRP